jgi:Holliday junction resolvase
MLERDIEKALVKRVKELGGKCEKFTSPGRRSVPDRIVTLPGNIIIFVELKAPSKTPTAKQLKDHKERLALGCDVRVIDTMEQVDAFPSQFA